MVISGRPWQGKIASRAVQAIEAGRKTTETIVEDARTVLRPGIQRGLDFVRPDALRKRTGVPLSDALLFAQQELLLNGLDKEDASEIRIALSKNKDTIQLTVSDNGTQKLSEKDLSLILDFDNEASSKRGLLCVSRGYLGNALKCILGYTYVLGGSPTVFESGPFKFTVRLIPDWARGRIDHELKVENREKDDGFTSVTVNFPNQKELLLNKSGGPIRFQDLVLSASYVNPDRKMSYDIFGEKKVCEPIVKQHRKRHNQETSALWYTFEEFDALLKDYCKAAPNMNLKHFMNIFRGMSSKDVQRGIIAEVGKKRQKTRISLDTQKQRGTAFFTISEADPKALFDALRKRSKPVEKRFAHSALGFVGKDNFKKLGEQNGWTNLRYTKYAGNSGSCDLRHPDPDGDRPCKDPSHKEYPWFLEVAVFDRGEYGDKGFEPSDSEGPKIYCCVNFAATERDTFRDIFDISGHLGRAGLRDHSVTVIAHYVSPILFWLNYGKSSLSE
jgi:hypothetical protein